MCNSIKSWPSQKTSHCAWGFSFFSPRINVVSIFITVYLSILVFELIKQTNDISGYFSTAVLGGLFAIVFNDYIFWAGSCCYFMDWARNNYEKPGQLRCSKNNDVVSILDISTNQKVCSTLLTSLNYCMYIWKKRSN